MIGVARIGTLLLAVVLVLNGSVVGTSVEAPELETERNPAVTESAGSLTAADNNSTVRRHADPARSRESDDASDVQRWLADELGSQLAGSTINLSQGEYEQARDLAGDDYNETLAKYVEAQGESAAEGENQTFARAQENQQRYITTVREFRQTHQRYREAKEEGNETRARQLARRLDELASEVNRSSQELLEDYHELSERESANLSASMGAVNETRENVSEIQSEVRNREFVRTELTVESETANVSFLEPLSVNGRLTAENGSAVEARSARFRIGSRTIATEVSDDGRFEFDYRPTLLPLNASEVTVQYVPSNESTYLGANATSRVNVSQVDPTVELSEVPEEAAFNETVVAAGNVSADGIAAEGVPVVVTVGDVEIAQTETDSNGSFRVEGELPLEVPGGDREIRATLPIEGRALASAADSADIGVRNTSSSLTVRADPINLTRVQVVGQLDAERNVSMSNRSIELRIGGTHLRTVGVNESGGYATIVELPAAARENGTATLVALQDANGTNLASSRANATVNIPYHWVLAERLPWKAAGVVGALGLLAVGLFVRSRRTWYRWLPFIGGPEVGRTQANGDGPPTEETDEGTGEGSEDDRTQKLRKTLDEVCSRRSARSPGQTVEATYAVVRGHLSNDHDRSSAKTHWEFYRAREDELEADERAALRRLTELYERAAFSRESTTETEATEAIEATSAFERTGVE